MRVRGSFFFLLIAALLIGIDHYVEAAIEEVGASARAVGLGGAFTALADDANAIYYNPAGLMQLSKKEISASYGLLNSGLNDGSQMNNSYVAYAHPLHYSIGSLGLAWQQFVSDPIIKEQSVHFGYGRRLLQGQSIGVGVKYLRREMTAPAGQTNSNGFVDRSLIDPVFAGGNSRANFAFDFGLLMHPWKKYALGILIQNINQPNMAIANNGEDKLLRAVKSGLAYQTPNFNMIGELDMVPKSGKSGNRLRLTLAGEQWWLSNKWTRADLGARGGFSLGSDQSAQMSMGLSYRMQKLQIDYGFLMPLKGISYGNQKGSHRINIAFRFGNIAPSPEQRAALRPIKSTLDEVKKEIAFYKDSALNAATEADQIKLREETRSQELKLYDPNNEIRKARVKEDFEREMNQYWTRKSKGLNLGDQKILLAALYESFRDQADLKISGLQKEYEIVTEKVAQTQMEYSQRWLIYLRASSQGLSVPDRLRQLSDIASAYASTGVSLELLENEMDHLSATGALPR